MHICAIGIFVITLRLKNVTDTDDLMIINLSGIIIRMGVSELRVMGRATQGVRLINLKDDDGIAAVAKVECELVETEDAEITDDVITSEIDGVDESSEENSTPEISEE